MVYEKIWYSRVESSPELTGLLKGFPEAWSFRDVNGDFIPDFVLGRVGPGFNPIEQDDPPITIMIGDSNYRFIPADTSDLIPGGWINDFVFIDSDKDNLVEIVAIDHGREIAYDPIYFSSLGVYEFDLEGAVFLDRTDETIGNEAGFYHNSANAADLDLDGIRDFFVAQLGPYGFRIFSGDSQAVIRDTTQEILGDRYSPLVDWREQSYDFTAAGASAVLVFAT